MVTDMVLKRKHILYFHHRLFLSFLLFSWVLVACFVFFQYHREKDFKVELLNAQMQLVNSQLQEVLEQKGDIREYMKQYPFFVEGLRVTLIRLDGSVIFDSEDSLLVKKENHLSRPEVRAAIQRGSGYTIRRVSSSTHEAYFYSASKNGGLIVRTAVPYGVSLKHLLKVDGTFLWFIAVLTILMSAAGYWATRRIGQSIRRLRNFAIQAGDGKEITIDEKFPKDELGEISNEIVRLYTRLQKTIMDFERERNMALYEAQEKIRIKRELTNNINHELKTPLASIRGYLETVLTHPEMDNEKRMFFLEKSFAQTERLSGLLRDVTTLTKLDEAGLVLKPEKVSINELLKEMANDLSLLSEDKVFQMFILFDKPVEVYGDPTMLHSIFRNLMDNAVAYSCGSSIYVEILREDNEFYTFSFADNGNGVEEKHLDNLFDRFYRVDKGRSRKLGGTGLGLSIVKNAVLKHGGVISVSNGRYGGLEFIFTLPKQTITEIPEV